MFHLLIKKGTSEKLKMNNDKYDSDHYIVDFLP